MHLDSSTVQCSVVALFDVIVGRSLNLTGSRDNLETVDEDGSLVGVHAELVLKQAGIAAKPEFACTVVFGEGSHHAVLVVLARRGPLQKLQRVQLGP